MDESRDVEGEAVISMFTQTQIQIQSLRTGLQGPGVCPQMVSVSPASHSMTFDLFSVPAVCFCCVSDNSAETTEFRAATSLIHLVMIFINRLKF